MSNRVSTPTSLYYKHLSIKCCHHNRRKCIGNIQKKKAPFYIALLDAKSAFDVVDIDILMRKLHLLDIQPSTWKIIDNLHHDTRTCIKWKQQVSDSFDCQQGVKQGELLSAELYKLYIEDLLRSYENSKIGCRIGTITINAVACADDIAFSS
jgi:hypothetical protein